MLAMPKVKDIFIIIFVIEIASIMDSAEAFFEAYGGQEEFEDLILI